MGIDRLCGDSKSVLDIGVLRLSRSTVLTQAHGLTGSPPSAEVPTA